MDEKKSRKKRKSIFSEDVLKNVRFEKQQLETIQEISALQSMYTGRMVSPSELIRDAVSFVFGDNERMRECFRRSRGTTTKKYLWR